MGVVYRARDERLERDVAVKVLPASLLGDEGGRARLLREARREYVQGRPLKALAQGEGLAEEVLRYGSQVAAALAHAHERGVIHRDLKSSNVVNILRTPGSGDTLLAMKRFVSFLTFALIAFWSAPAAVAQNARPLQIYFVDVEGGAATLMVTPAGESLLVDTGWQREDGRDAKRIQRAAQQAGLKRIDHLLTTHFHQDHFGGVGELSRLIPIGKFYDHGRSSELAEELQKNFPKLNEAYLQASKGQTQALKPGRQIALKQAPETAPIRLQVVASDGEVMQLKMRGPENSECKDVPLQKDDPSENARSLGFLLIFGKFRFLDLGDLTWNIEHKLVCPTNVLGTVTLYQATHHGMNISNNPALLRSVRPQVAVFNNGPRKGGHPDVVRWLRALPGLQDIWQGHQNLAAKDEENVAPEFIANLGAEQECAGHLIQVSVASDGAGYTVTNARTGQSRKYATSN